MATNQVSVSKMVGGTSIFNRRQFSDFTLHKLLLLSVTGLQRVRELIIVYFYRATLCQRGICRRHVSVCLCVGHTSVLYQNGYTQDHANNATRQHRDSSLLTRKITAKFELDHLLRGRQMQWGGLNLPLSTNNSLLHKNGIRRIVSIKVEQEVICALSNGYVADDLE